MLLKQIHPIVRHIRKLATVERPANADVGLHRFHPRGFKLGRGLHADFRGRTIQSSQYLVVLPTHQWHGAALRGTFHQSGNQGGLGQVKGFDEYVFALLQAAAMI
jgi:hypothetical protein